MFKQLLQQYRSWQYNRIIAQRRFESKTVAEIFTETFRNRYWKSKESVSGMGSELGQTGLIRAALPILFRQYNIRSLLDLPCGDFNWMQHVDLQGIQYTGGDIVAALVQRNQAQFGAPKRSFVQLDLLTDPLPAADCIMLRDCLVHFSLTHIEQALSNIRSSNIPYLLTTSFPQVEQNEDIQTGYWRPLNLQKAPFFFPPPLVILADAGANAGRAYADKSLCLWETAAVFQNVSST